MKKQGQEHPEVKAPAYARALDTLGKLAYHPARSVALSREVEEFLACPGADHECAPHLHALENGLETALSSFGDGGGPEAAAVRHTLTRSLERLQEIMRRHNVTIGTGTVKPLLAHHSYAHL